MPATVTATVNAGATPPGRGSAAGIGAFLLAATTQPGQGTRPGRGRGRTPPGTGCAITAVAGPPGGGRGPERGATAGAKAAPSPRFNGAGAGGPPLKARATPAGAAFCSTAGGRFIVKSLASPLEAPFMGLPSGTRRCGLRAFIIKGATSGFIIGLGGIISGTSAFVSAGSPTLRNGPHGIGLISTPSSSGGRAAVLGSRLTGFGAASGLCGGATRGPLPTPAGPRLRVGLRVSAATPVTAATARTAAFRASGGFGPGPGGRGLGLLSTAARGRGGARLASTR